MDRKIIGLAGILSIATSSQAILVDDFTSGNLYQSQKVSYYTSVSGSMLGGNRYSYTGINANPNSRFATHEVDIVNSPGSYFFETGAGVDSWNVLFWHAGVVSPAPLSGPGSLTYGQITPFTAADISGDSFFALDYESNDQSNLSLSFLIADSNYVNIDLTSSVFVPAGSGTLLVPFSSLTTSTVNKSAITGFGVVFNAPTGNDIVLKKVYTAVPEPTTMATLAVALVALSRNRRKA